MSKADKQQSTVLNADTVHTIASLAKLSLDESQSIEYATSLNKILEMMSALQQFDTENIEPLKSPFDHPQPLRSDVVSESNQREQYQAIAPATQDGLYLVPRVIE